MPVCEFVQSKINIPILSSGDNEGVVEWVNEDVDSILSNDQVMKLVYKGSGEYSFLSMNWSYSKGDTVSSACVIPTNRFENLDQEGVLDIRYSSVDYQQVVCRFDP